MFDMEKEKYTKEDAISILREKSRELHERGEERFPRRGDFDDAEVMAIKSHLGPWPRALEAAGLKEPRSFDRIERNRKKRREAAKKRRDAEKDQ